MKIPWVASLCLFENYCSRVRVKNVRAVENIPPGITLEGNLLSLVIQHTHTHVHVCVYICMHVHMYMCVCVCMYLYMSIPVPPSSHVFPCARLCVCVQSFSLFLQKQQI